MHQLQMGTRSASLAMLAALVIGSLVPGTVAAATRSMTYSATIGLGCVFGRASDGATVEFVWRAGDGTRKERASIASSADDGHWSYCSTDGDVVAVGDSFFAHDGASSHVFVVPELSLAIDRANNRFKGRAPGGDYVRLICGYVDGHAPCMASWKIKVNAQGKFGYSPDFDVQGWQQMYLRWKSEAGDQVGVEARGPFVGVTIGSSVVRGATRPNVPATVFLRRAGSDAVVATATKTADGVGLFQARFRKANGQLVKVRVGDRITSDVSSDVNVIVPDVAATADAASNMATGSCGAGAYIVTAEVIRGGEPDPAHAPGDSEAGYFEVELGYPPLESGEPVTIGCMLNAGDWVSRRITAE